MDVCARLLVQVQRTGTDDGVILLAGGLRVWKTGSLLSDIHVEDGEDHHHPNAAAAKRRAMRRYLDLQIYLLAL